MPGWWCSVAIPVPVSLPAAMCGAKLWVAKNGRVLKQEMPLFDSTMVFARLPDKEAAAMAERAGITKPANGGFSR